MAHTEGAVTLHVIIGTDGSVKEVTPTGGHPLLVPAAVVAVRQWRYRPFLLDGDPIEVDTTVSVDFRLDSSEPNGPSRE
jgi:protein TonB